MASGILYDGFRTLLENGLVEMLIFALIFALVYGILENVKLFGAKKDTDTKGKLMARKIHAVIALVIAALSIIPHYVSRGSKYDIVPIITKFLPEVAIGVLVILCALILLGMFGFSFTSAKGKKNPVAGFIVFAIIAYVIWILGDSMYWDLPRWMTYELVAVIVAVLVFVAIIKFVMGDDEDAAGNKKKTFLENLNELLKHSDDDNGNSGESGG